MAIIVRTNPLFTEPRFEEAIRGSTDPMQQWLEQSYDPSSGFTYRREFRGLSDFKMAQLSNFYTRRGCAAVLRHEHGISTLTITDSTGEVLIDKWELGVDEEQPSVFENPKFLAVVNAAADSEKVIAMMRSQLQNGDPENSGWTTLTRMSGWTAAVTGADTTKLKQYFKDYNLGVTNFIRGKYALRHTTNAPANWNANIADSNVEKIYTISQLLSEVQNRALWVLPMPGYLAYKIQHYEQPPARANYTWGALKKRSNAVTSARNRVDITTEYLIDMVNTNLYDPI